MPTRANVTEPVKLTVSIDRLEESPSCLEKVEEAVEMIAFTPLHSALSEAWSFRSRRHNSDP